MRRAALVALACAGVAFGVIAEQQAYAWRDLSDWLPDLLAGWTLIGLGIALLGLRTAARRGDAPAACGLLVVRLQLREHRAGSRAVARRARRLPPSCAAPSARSRSSGGTAANEAHRNRRRARVVGGGRVAVVGQRRHGARSRRRVRRDRRGGSTKRHRAPQPRRSRDAASPQPRSSAPPSPPTPLRSLSGATQGATDVTVLGYAAAVALTGVLLFKAAMLDAPASLTERAVALERGGVTLRDALRDLLGDPELEIGFALGPGELVDDHGRPLAPRSAGSSGDAGDGRRPAGGCRRSRTAHARRRRHSIGGDRSGRPRGRACPSADGGGPPGGRRRRVATEAAADRRRGAAAARRAARARPRRSARGRRAARARGATPARRRRRARGRSRPNPAAARPCAPRARRARAWARRCRSSRTRPRARAAHGRPARRGRPRAGGRDGLAGGGVGALVRLLGEPRERRQARRGAHRSVSRSLRRTGSCASASRTTAVEARTRADQGSSGSPTESQPSAGVWRSCRRRGAGRRSLPSCRCRNGRADRISTVVSLREGSHRRRHGRRGGGGRQATRDRSGCSRRASRCRGTPSSTLARCAGRGRRSRDRDRRASRRTRCTRCTASRGSNGA